jgi:hypothetical protein
MREVMEARLVLVQFAADKVIRLGAAACKAAYGRLSAEIKRQRKAGSARDLGEFLESDRAFQPLPSMTRATPSSWVLRLPVGPTDAHDRGVNGP